MCVCVCVCVCVSMAITHSLCMDDEMLCECFLVAKNNGMHNFYSALCADIRQCIYIGTPLFKILHPPLLAHEGSEIGTS